ncbi:uncharacterized mitochondrial protein AtMg01250-like [Medicago truncatula]|uniref:uncharacterized mitochondrial protein AtMg01250-like n=1 Tax=Medicago truncatula TaxID=3880 RepID=UPI000D2F4019|nr:uncharacterized mitochondrial protein AtMg01250-like [Medicago truncatula]
MIVIEVVHHMKISKRSRDKNVALKLYIGKGYVCIDRLYLKEVMQKLEFANRWVRWIMMCVETDDYSVIVNNESVGPIFLGRGLRQGDPLSPYLFILCAEGHLALIHKGEWREDMHDISICTNAPVISHLLFADDCFLFFWLNEIEAHMMKHILEIYEAVSSQAINLPKSEVYYNHNVSAPLKDFITTTLDVRAVMGTGKYLNQ